ncbi:hypothetical protein CK203_112560 [Vitis vinifera]|uniref:Uncharacterized protein n=1 Tax=Vitis vinifera TaxID=29760 RepID=A0A438DJJ1_VITVI|nr:hypothetical protein CK203_112560 [Vitis vinifera]
MTRPEVPGPNAVTVAQPGVTAHNNAPTAMETRGTEGVLEAAIDEEASDKKRVSCFTDVEAHSTRMSDFFSLTKRVSVNMGGDPPAFVKARLPFSTPESAVSYIQHLQEWTIPDTAEVVVAGIHYMMHICEQLFKRLEVVEAMRAFISHHLGGVEEMRSRLEKVEAELATAQKAVADGAEKLSQAEEGEGDWVEQENSQLKKEVDELQASLAAQKETERLQASLVAQREEMEAGFVAQKKELETEYQRQVEEMYLFDYRCCMKKNDIMHDVLSLPCDDEDAIPGGPSC